eukprot:GHVO01063787.1.p1 GENE.GHVO01063787.1~~GHVO01063787.1.p1  ORF type:complete len:362 (-),score=-1.24 GHVO01063787.1:148-1182(-)
MLTSIFISTLVLASATSNVSAAALGRRGLLGGNSDSTGALGTTSIGNLVGNTATTAGNLLGTTTTNTGNLLGNTATKAGNLLSNTATNAGNLLGTTTTNTGNLLGNTVTNAGNLLSNTATNAGNLLGTTTTNTGNLLGNTVTNVGNLLSNTATNAGNLLGSTTTNAGNLVGSTTTNVGDILLQLLSSANNFGAPIPPWKAGPNPGWYCGSGPNPGGYPNMQDPNTCSALATSPSCLQCPTQSTTAVYGYDQKFSNLKAATQDASYITYGLVDTINDCAKMCTMTSGCTFFNTYHDNNGKGGSTQLTCSLFSICQTAYTATNKGGQTQSDGSTNYITDSNGYCKK